MTNFLSDLSIATMCLKKHKKTLRTIHNYKTFKEVCNANISPTKSNLYLDSSIYMFQGYQIHFPRKANTFFRESTSYMLWGKHIHVPGKTHTLSKESRYMFQGKHIHFPRKTHTCSRESTYIFHGKHIHVPGKAHTCSMESTYMFHGKHIHDYDSILTRTTLYTPYTLHKAR